MAEPFYGADLARVHDEGFDFWVRAAMPAVRGHLRAAGIERGLVVELGCGSGISTRALLDAGYDVLGVDVSAEMLAIARERAPGTRFVQASAHEVELPPCAAVTAIGEVLNYGAPATLAPLFARVAAALPPGGLLLFDAAAPGREPDGVRRGSYEGEGWTVDVESVEDRSTRTLTRRIALVCDGRRSEEVHVLRLHEPAEVERWLRDAGFAVERRDAYGDEQPLVPGLPVYVATRTRRR